MNKSERIKQLKSCVQCQGQSWENVSQYRHPQQITWHGYSFGVFNICTDFLMPSPPATTRQQSPVCITLQEKFTPKYRP